MHIGIPKETMPFEGRVGLVPEACADLVRAGHKVMLQSGAGVTSGYDDAAYQQAGVLILDSLSELVAEAELLIKVKQPDDSLLGLLQQRHTLFCFLHLAADKALAARLQQIGCTAIGFETVSVAGKLPVLAPMSEIAGRLSVQIGAGLLHGPHGGRGVMLGGIASTDRGRVVILGAGHAGHSACQVAAALAAKVTVFDLNRERLQAARDLGNNVTALYPFEDRMQEQISRADLLIGAVLIAGARAPHLVSESLVQEMQPGSVIVDISVDQGGCIETTRPTDYNDPVFRYADVVHFGVTNMPGAVARTASQALSSVLLPYALRLAASSDPGADQMDPVLIDAINVRAGQIVNSVVAQALEKD